jgi:uncharacterized secreted protein with C-terminal beta-propeller domain
MSFSEEYRNAVDEVSLDQDARNHIERKLAQAQKQILSEAQEQILAEVQESQESDLIEVPVGVRVVEPTPSQTPSRPRRWRFGVWIPAVTFAACALLFLVALPLALLNLNGVVATGDAPSSDAVLSEEMLASLDSRYAPDAYADIYDVISRLSEQFIMSKSALSSTGVAELEDSASPDVSLDAPEASRSFSVQESDTDGGSGHDYSSTNVQVEGIDEADIVKTDGEYLYILTGQRLVIARADGKNTHIVSDTRLNMTSPQADTTTPLPPGVTYRQGRAADEPSDFSLREMFLADDRVIIIATAYEFSAIEATSNSTRPALPRSLNPFGLVRDLVMRRWLENRIVFDDPISAEYYDSYDYQPRVSTIALTLDVSDPRDPRPVARSGQDGEYVTARMTDGIVYLITTHYVWETPLLDHPETFVPRTFSDSDALLLAPGRIIIPDCPQSAGYVVVTSLSAQTGQHLDGLSLLGYTGTVYMSHDNLIIAQSFYDERTGDSWMEGPYLVEESFDGYITSLVRLGLDEGALSFEAEGTVDGDLLNQFSIDEYHDTIRVVTTVAGSRIRTYTDQDRGFVNYEYLDTNQTNALTVLDRDLRIIGAVTDLAPDEQVYSVRFAGEVAYFVTFRQVDPLFVVDLSDPRHPEVLSALKIPGFSQYLHVWDEGLLFGLGMEADEDTGRSSTMKLSMFDTTRPTAVFERDKLVLDASYSEALTNHKAILIVPEIGIIAFPTDEGFIVFTYSKTDGFAQRGRFSFSDAYDARGVLIDDLLYVCSPTHIGVFELERFAPLASIVF